MTDPAITIAVVSWNTSDLLRECLASMKPDFDAGLIEVHVLDNASSDGSADMVADAFPWVRLTRGDENLGYGTAVNRIASQSDTPWLAPANSDIRLTPGALQTMLAAADDDRAAGLLAPRLILPDGSTQPAVAAFPTLGRAILELSQAWRFSRKMRVKAFPYLELERGRRVDWVAGAFLLVRADAFRRAGGFQESQWMYAEDLDLSWRLRANGWSTRYVPGAVVHHEHSAAADKAFGDSVVARQHDANWAWSVQRFGRLRTAAIAALPFIEGCVRLPLAMVARRGADTARDRLAFGRRGFARAFARD